MDTPVMVALVAPNPDLTVRTRDGCHYTPDSSNQVYVYPFHVQDLIGQGFNYVTPVVFNYVPIADPDAPTASAPMAESVSEPIPVSRRSK